MGEQGRAAAGVDGMTPSKKLTVEARVQLWDDAARICHYCDKKTPRPGTKAGTATHIDHKIPQSKGGTYAPENLVIACKRCNTEKGNRDYIAFLESRADQARKQLFRLDQLIVAFYASQE